MSVPRPQLSLTSIYLPQVVGMLAEGIGTAAIIRQVIVSPNQATSLLPGQAVKYDTSLTGNSVPGIVACAQNAYADGYVIYDIKNGGNASNSPLTSGTVCQICIFGAMLMLVDGTTIQPGQVVEDGADAGGVEPLGTTAGAFPRGVALAYGVSGAVIPVDLYPGVTKVVAAAA